MIKINIQVNSENNFENKNENYKNLKKQADEVLKIAQKHEVEQNYFFLTTFKRYQVQLEIIDGLEKAIKDEGLLITKEYVKGRQNLCSNPAVTDFNRTTDSANKTVSTLVGIILKLRKKKDDLDDDPLLEFLNGKKDYL